MEENTQEESEVSVNIQEIPQTPTQTPLEVGHNDIHMPAFHPFHPGHPTHPIFPMTPASYIPHGYTQLSSPWTNIPMIPVHSSPAATVTRTPEYQPLNVPLSQGGEEAKSRLTVNEKVNKVLNLLKSIKWSIGDFLHYTFAMQDSTKKSFIPTNTHYQMVSKFLTGETNIRVAHILDLWMKSTYGLPAKDHLEWRYMYSTEVDYLTIQYARPAITAFTAQLVKERLVREAKTTVKSDGGLHTFTTGKKERISRYDLGANSFQEASEIFQEKTPLAWHLLLAMSASNEDTIARERRPPEMVSNEWRLEFSQRLVFTHTLL